METNYKSVDWQWNKWTPDAETDESFELQDGDWVENF